jgi:hypothetical protein
MADAVDADAAMADAMADAVDADAVSLVRCLT